MAHLKNQVAIITGGGSGIGFAIAEAVAAENMAIVICGRNKNKLAEIIYREWNAAWTVLIVFSMSALECAIERKAASN